MIGIIEQKGAPCGISKDPELQHIVETFDVTRGKPVKIGSWRGLDIRMIRIIGQSLVLVTLYTPTPSLIECE